MKRTSYTTTEAAEVLGVTAARVRQLVLDGKIEAEKVGRDLLIPMAAIEQAKRRKTKPGPASKAKGEEVERTVATLSEKATKQKARAKKTVK